jgi:DNA processing protein
MNTKLTDWLILHLAPRFGPANWKKCLTNFSSPTAICQMNVTTLERMGLAPESIQAIQNPALEKIEQIKEWAQQPNHHLLTLEHPSYPPLLKQITSPPPVLYIDGQLDLLANPQIALVGARKPTYNAIGIAKYFAKSLANQGLTITSGLALGIDTASHEGVVNDNKPTIAVLGTGVDIIYPKKNRKLADKIKENGAIVSEFPISSSPQRYHFPQRNRTISGLSLGTLVIEATRKSGSLITAKSALVQNREVFAIPGSILNPMVAGCHQLIQQGAKLVTCIDDVLEEIGFISNKKQRVKPLSDYVLTRLNQTKLDKDHKKLLECIRSEMRTFEQIVDATGFSIQKVSAMLCKLKLNGYIKEELGGYSQVAL